MQAIRQWLERLGLAHYAEIFEGNDVDLDILPSLTEEDLHRLGVSLGDRKRILRALQDPDPRHTYNGHLAPSFVPGIESLTVQGERRQVTVLFCDLVGSTALSATRDPEEYRSILERYHDTCIASVRRFEGFVAQIQGDGVLAYFGYPLAHENEADRAVRAGLSIVGALATQESGLDQPLQVRIGIASGLVVVSHILAPDKRAVGETPNLAARLQTIALPNEVLVGDSTRLLAGGGFEYEDRGVHALKGIALPIQTWGVLRESSAASRFEAATRGSITPMVGRAQEIGLLLNRWERSRSADGQVVLLQGEAGIGKSRMLQAFRERLGGKVEAALQYQCSPYFTNSAFYPIADHLGRALKFERDDDADQKLDKLERYLLGSMARGLTDCGLLARALAIACDERYGRVEITPQRQKDETIALMVELIAEVAERHATVVLFEDLHWADPTTLEVLAALVDRTEQLPLLVLTTCRPEYESSWKARSHVTLVPLSRLSRTQGASIVLRVAGSKPLPSDLVSLIVDKTDGVPLFLEELTKTVLESAMVVDLGDRYDYTGELNRMGVPATLRDSLMTRLDRLIPVKEIAQIGACLGREFSYELVRAISPMDEVQLGEALEKLADAELVSRRGTPPEAVYTFKHALVQDAAYDSLLKSRRQSLHAEIARILEIRFPSIRDTRPELIAHHYTAAAMAEQAVGYWKRAGELAHTRIALHEAIAHLEHGLEVALTLPPSQIRDRHELELRGQLGMAWIALQGWAYPAVAEHLKPAYALEEALTPGQHSLRVLWGLWVYALALGRTRDSLAVAEELLAQGRNKGEEEMLQAGLWAVVTTHYWLGEFEKSIEYADAILERYDPIRHHALADALNHDPKTVALQYKAASQGLLGYADTAAVTMKATLEHARNRGHSFDHAWALFFAIYQFHGIQQDPVAIDLLLAEFEPLVRDQRLLAFEHLLGPFCRAIRHMIDGSSKDADRILDQLIPKLAAAGLEVVTAEARTLQARCAILLHEPERALVLLEDVLNVILQPGGETLYFQAEVLRVRGQALEEMGRLDEAGAVFQSAIDQARSQKSKWWELRAATSLARLWQKQHRRKAALELLTPVHGWFIEGHSSRDLCEATALLAELGQTSSAA